MLSGKVWGKTKSIFDKAAFELHRIEVQPGGYCSKHKHLFKFNGFYVESGELEVTVWQPSGTVDVTVLGPGDFMEVKPPVTHRFRSPKGCVAFEAYWTELYSEDIEREDVGGSAGLKCSVCGKPLNENNKRRQMTFEPVDVCKGCVSRMEKPDA